MRLSLVLSSGCYDDPNWLGPNGTILFRDVPTYNIVFTNISGPELTDYSLYWEKSAHARIILTPSGVLPQADTRRPILGGRRGITNVAPHLLPESAIIEWEDPTGSQHQQTVKLSLPNSDRCNFRGEIWIIYNNGHWDELAVTTEQEQYRAAHGQSIIPTPAYWGK
jgi:hypothetical protein